MTVKYIVQYRYEVTGDGEWKDEFEADSIVDVRERMVEHIRDFETMRCRVIKREYSVKEEEVGTYVPPGIFEEEES